MSIFSKASVFSAAVLVSASTLLAGGAGPVRTYTRSPDPSRSEGLRSARPYLPLADPRPGDALLTPAPYPDNRTDGPDRVQNGRLWVPRAPVGTRSPLAELPRGTPGADAFGAPEEENDTVIFVRSSLQLPLIAISPFTKLDARTTDEIERLKPTTGRMQTRFRSSQILRELKEAQNQWLREQGYILRVRTHANAAHVLVPKPESKEEAGTEADAADAKNPEPRAVIRVRERNREPAPTPLAEAEREWPAEPGPAVTESEAASGPGGVR